MGTSLADHAGGHSEFDFTVIWHFDVLEKAGWLNGVFAEPVPNFLYDSFQLLLSFYFGRIGEELDLFRNVLGAEVDGPNRYRSDWMFPGIRMFKELISLPSYDGCAVCTDGKLALPLLTVKLTVPDVDCNTTCILVKRRV